VVVTARRATRGKQLIARDLEVLEGVRERRELPGRVGMRPEKGAPVQAAEPHRRVLEHRRAGVVHGEAALDHVRMLTRLLQVAFVDLGEERVARRFGSALQQRDRLPLDRMGIG
jgi:hypothetical protein